MKNCLLYLSFLLIPIANFAQGVFSNKTNQAIETVLQDYGNQFGTIKGNLLHENGQLSTYQSTVLIPGAISCKIIMHSNQAVQWQAVLYSSNSFEESRKRFKELFSQIKNTIIRMENDKPIILNGRFETPEPTNTHTIIPFDLLPANRFAKKLQVSLAMQQQGGEWKIILNVHDAPVNTLAITNN
jgi:hypothetical protein